MNMNDYWQVVPIRGATSDSAAPGSFSREPNNTKVQSTRLRLSFVSSDHRLSLSSVDRQDYDKADIDIENGVL